jgi:hypothetical protein
MRQGGRVEFRQQRAAADVCSPGLRVNPDVVQQAQVEHHAAIAGSGARCVVRAAADGDLKLMLAGEADRRGHVGR